MILFKPCTTSGPALDSAASSFWFAGQRNEPRGSTVSVVLRIGLVLVLVLVLVLGSHDV